MSGQHERAVEALTAAHKLFSQAAQSFGEAAQGLTSRDVDELDLLECERIAEAAQEIELLMGNEIAPQVANILQLLWQMRNRDDRRQA